MSAIDASAIFAPTGLSAFGRLRTALWVYDFDAARILWANEAALALWDAPDAGALTARDLGREMSVSVRERLAQHLEEFRVDPGREIHELWTLYPQSGPVRVRACLRRCDLPDGRVAMSVEAAQEEIVEPVTVRSADALLHTRVMTALYDAGGAELYANPAYRAAFGPGRRRFGEGWLDLAAVGAFAEGLDARGEHRGVVEVRTVAGPRWHDVHARRCRDAVTGGGGFLISATDVTEARAYETRLAAARDAAEAADRAKSAFLATMSHELRTPLNGVLGMASLLERTGLDPRQAAALDVIRASGAQMLEMVEDMLDIVTIDSGEARLAPRPFDPTLLLESVAATVRDDARRRGLRLAVDTRDLGAREALHDAARIRQVLRHLATNAVKFTERGAVMLRVAEEAEGALLFEVLDTGPGVPEAERDRIFERFHQVDGSWTRRHGGTGLGLAICRDLVRLWGGRIGVRCPDAGGSVFWFTVPGALPHDAAA